MTNLTNVPSRIGFIIQRSRLRGRLDAEYNYALLSIHFSSIYPLSKIRDIATFRTGGTPSKAHSDYWEGDIPWASPKDFTSFYLADTEDHISDAAVAESATSIVPPETPLLVFRSGILQHTLPVTITTTKTAINQDLKAILLKPGILAEYIAIYFMIFSRYLLPLITKSGATVQSINSEQFEQLMIPIPPKEKQLEIIRMFLHADEVKRLKESNARQILNNIDKILLDELGIHPNPEPSNTINSRIFATSFLNITGTRFDPLYHQGDAFRFIRNTNCNLERLGNYVNTFITGFAAGREDQGDDEDGIIQIRPTNISDDRELIFRRNVYISPTELKKRPQDILKRREVLFNNTNSQERVGKTAYFDLAGNYFCSNHITRIATDRSRLDPQYLGYILNLYQHQKVFFKLCTNWNNQSGVGADVLANIPIPHPELKDQEQIVYKLEKVRTEAQELRYKAAAYFEEAKRSIENIILGQ